MAGPSFFSCCWARKQLSMMRPDSSCVAVCVATDPVAVLIACAIIVVMGSRDELGANEGCLFSTVVLTTVVAAIPALAPRQHDAPDGCIEFVHSLGGGPLLSTHNDSCRLES